MVWVFMPDFRCREFATGNADGNNDYLNIELINESIEWPYPVADDTIETFCQFIADRTREGWIEPADGVFVWGAERGDRTSLMPHINFAGGTACPGQYLMDRGEEIAARINELLAADSEPDPEPEPEPPTIDPEPPIDEPAPAPELVFEVGDVVVPTRLVSYDGVSLVQYDPAYTIIEVIGDRAVLFARGAVWAALNISDIRLA
jgi:hypothetical protein